MVPAKKGKRPLFFKKWKRWQSQYLADVGDFRPIIVNILPHQDSPNIAFNSSNQLEFPRIRCPGPELVDFEEGTPRGAG